MRPGRCGPCRLPIPRMWGTTSGGPRTIMKGLHVRVRFGAGSGGRWRSSPDGAAAIRTWVRNWNVSVVFRVIPGVCAAWPGLGTGRTNRRKKVMDFDTGSPCTGAGTARVVVEVEGTWASLLREASAEHALRSVVVRIGSRWRVRPGGRCRSPASPPTSRRGRRRRWPSARRCAARPARLRRVSRRTPAGTNPAPTRSR